MFVYQKFKRMKNLSNNVLKNVRKNSLIPKPSNKNKKSYYLHKYHSHREM